MGSLHQFMMYIESRNTFRLFVFFHLVKRDDSFSCQFLCLMLSLVISVQVGAELQFRVLGCKSKRITVTHKKTLVCFSRLTMNKLINFKELL